MNENEKIELQEKFDFANLNKALRQLLCTKMFDINKTRSKSQHDAEVIINTKNYNVEIKCRYKDEKRYPDTIIQLNKYIHLQNLNFFRGENAYVFIFYPLNDCFYLYRLSDLTKYFFKNSYTIDYVWIDEYDHSKGKHNVANIHLDLLPEHRHPFKFDEKITKEQIMMMSNAS